jgi:MFS family permease
LNQALPRLKTGWGLSNALTIVTRHQRVLDFLGLERNIVAVAGAMFLMGLGEELWKRFLPKYLAALGAPVLAIGFYGTVRDFLDGLYQYPGGWIADRYGPRRALTFFVALAAAGYGVYSAAPSWHFIFVGVFLVMAWSAMASPTLFAVVGQSLPQGRRAMGFTVQAIVRRVPIVVAPTLGGLAIAAFGVRQGIRAGLAITIVLALVTIAVTSAVRVPPIAIPDTTNMRGVWRSLPSTFRRLLLSDVFIRTCEGLVDVFIVLYVTNVLGMSTARFGFLVAVQTVTSILIYIPAARLADSVGRKPFVIATFLAFSMFPLAVVRSHTMAQLAAAFIVGGLREIGEPARKALIVDLAQAHLRARSVGLYYLVRSCAVAPAGLIGGALWRIEPRIPFYTAGAIGLVGAALFALTVPKEHAG